MSSKEAISGVKKYLNNAVKRQVISDAPLGAFLSGGLDSSAIVAYARKYVSNLKTFTIDIEGGNEKGTVDDLYYAKRVSKHLNVQLEIIKINSSKMADDIELMVKSLDEPIADPAALNVYYISKAAKDQGIKVLLSGTGGDDIFTGYRRHYAYMNEYLWNWLPNSFKKILKKTSYKFKQNNLITRRINKLFSGIDLDENERLLNYFRWIQREDLKKLYTPEFSQIIKDSDPSIDMLDFLNDLPMQTSKLDRMLGLEQRYFLSNHNLLYTDRMSMAAGVEVRVPFLDKDLVNFVYKIPDSYKQRGVHGKWVLKKSLEGTLPNSVIYRPKTGFGAPLRRWIRQELRELLMDTLSAKRLRQRGLFDPKAVLNLMNDNDKGKIDASYTLLTLLCIEIWYNNYIKN